MVAAAEDGSGPSAGTEVVTFGWSGGWAELRAVDTDELAPVPDGVGLADVAALPVAGALDNVGGPLLADVYRLVENGGTVQSVGMASGQPTTIDFEHARVHNGGARIEAFTVGTRFGSDLAYLAGLMATGRLDPQVGWPGPWGNVAEAADALLGRRVRGKAVLEVGQ